MTRSRRSSSEKTERSAPRYILRLTFCSKAARACSERAAAPNPDRAADRADARAAGAFLLPRLLPEPLTSERFFWAFVPERPAARVSRHDLVDERRIERDAERRVRKLGAFRPYLEPVLSTNWTFIARSRVPITSCLWPRLSCPRPSWLPSLPSFPPAFGVIFGATGWPFAAVLTHHAAVLRTRNRAFDQQHVALGVYAEGSRG
mgnify:CR=1 FL=1